MNIPEITLKMGGKLMSAAVLQNGKVVKEYDYGDGHSNTIVDSGLDNILAFSGAANEYSSAYSYLFGGLSAYNGYPYGMLRLCKRGTGSTETTFDMTDLEASIGSTTTVLSNNPNTGTRYDRENGYIYMRVTHDHAIETSDQNINELGYFGSHNSATLKMFSRIVLPSTITVQTDQQLRTTYELRIQIGPITPTACGADLITGWDTTGVYQLTGNMPATSATYGSTGNSFLPAITTDGSALNTAGPEIGTVNTFVPFAYTTNTSYYYGIRLITSAITLDDYPYYAGGINTGNYQAYGYPNGGSMANTGNASGTATFGNSAYVAGTFYRDMTVVLNANWPGVDVTVYGIVMWGLVYIFDTPQTKSTTQRLTLTYRVSYARA